MKIKCMTNKVSSVPREILKNYSIDLEDFPIKEEKEYLVYAVSIYLDYVWYCICDEIYTYYPKWRPSMLFKVTDNRLSHYWIFGLKKVNQDDDIKKMPSLGFPEWVNDEGFYSDLVDGYYDNVSIFRKYKELMDLEFPDPSISMTAEIADRDWLICPKCIDAWESSNDQDALVKCPICRTLFNNPRYKNEWPHL